jgi:hypothetical protein
MLQAERNGLQQGHLLIDLNGLSRWSGSALGGHGQFPPMGCSGINCQVEIPDSGISDQARGP